MPGGGHESLGGLCASPRLAAATCIVVAAVVCAGLSACGPGQPPPAARTVRVCADPTNLPFSNEAREGFENRVAELAARDLGAALEYVWWPPRRGFLRNTLRAGMCDVIIGVPSSFELAATTRPYYRSTYVFVTRAGVLTIFGLALLGAGLGEAERRGTRRITVLRKTSTHWGRTARACDLARWKRSARRRCSGMSSPS